MFSLLNCQNVTVGEQLGKHGWSAAQRRSFPSVWSNILFVAVRLVFWMWVGFLMLIMCVCESKSAWMLLTWFQSWSGRLQHGAVTQTVVWRSHPFVMVMLAKPWDYVVLCIFYFQTWPLCCQSSVYVNCCHTKKSHINSKRHNKLLLWECWTFYYTSCCRENALASCYPVVAAERAVALSLQTMLHAAVFILWRRGARALQKQGRAMANKLQSLADQGHQIKVCSSKICSPEVKHVSSSFISSCWKTFKRFSAFNRKSNL